MNRDLRKTLLATTSLAAVMLEWGGAAQAACITNPATPFTNNVAIDCVTFQDGATHVGDVVNSSTGVITAPGGPGLIGLGTGISLFTAGTTIQGNITNNGSITSVFTNTNSPINGIGISAGLDPGAVVTGSITNNQSIVVTGVGIYVGSDVNGSIVNNKTMTTGWTALQVTGTNSGVPVVIGGSVINNGTITFSPHATVNFPAGDNPAHGIEVFVATVDGDVGNTDSITTLGQTAIVIGGATVGGKVFNSGTIITTGTSTNPTVFSVGIGIYGSTVNAVENTGTITSDVAGIWVGGTSIVTTNVTNGPNGNITVNNGVGIRISNLSPTGITTGASTIGGQVINQGTIIAKTGIQVVGSMVTGGITNTGNITGTTAAIDLTGEAAATTFNQAGGTVTGDILLSGLSDTINISGGVINGNIVGNSAVNHANAGTINVNLGGGAFTTGGTIDVGAINVNSGTFDIANSVTVFGALTNHATVGVANGTAVQVGSFAQSAGGTLSLTTGTSFAGTDVKVVSSGPVNLAGALDLNVKFTGTKGETLTLLESGGRTGTFGKLDITVAWAIEYTADDVLAIYTGNFVNVPGLTPNEAAVATALNTAFATGGLPQFKTAFGALNSTQFAAVLDQLSSEGYSDYGAIAMENSVMFSNAVFAALSSIQPGSGLFAQSQRIQIADNEPWHLGSPYNAPWGAWLSGGGTEGSLDGNGNAHGIDYTAGGGAAGLDYRFNPNFTAGVSAGAMSTSFNLTGVTQKGTTNSYQFAVYGGWHNGPFYVDGLLGYAYDTEAVRRTVTVPTLGQASGNTDGNQFIAAAEIGYAYPIGPMTYATPFLDMTGGVAGLNGFTETGPTLANLHVNSQTTDSFRTVLGGQISTVVPIGLSAPVAVMARAGWAHEFAETASVLTANFTAAPGANFAVTGAAPIRDAAEIGLGAQLPIAPNASLFARYDGEFSGTGHANAVTGGLRFTW